MRKLAPALTALVALTVTACAPRTRPETPPPVAPASAATAQKFVVTANPLASEAGMAVLRRGGSAVDAAIAVQAMLSLVEPQSSGVGGGAFLTYYNAATRKVEIYDGREIAPAGATPTMFMGADGKPLPFGEAVVGGRATGVPGAVRMLAQAHDDHGALAWKTLFEDAERTARKGFTVSPRLGRFLNGSFPQLAVEDTRRYFTEKDGTLVDPGDVLRNKDYAEFLRRLAKRGPDALYTGETAKRIVARTNTGALPGTLTLADLAGYRAVKRDPLCGNWHVYVVCVPPPPSSGVGLLELLALLGRTDIEKRGPADPQAWYLFAEASRLMYADRDRYVGDPAFVRVPVAGLLAPSYIADRVKLIAPLAGPAPVAGVPAGAVVAGADTTVEPVGTSHFIVGDARGNVVSMTTTVESIFGTGRMVDGFFLNNQMTDFAFSPVDADGRPAANAVAAGKRPRSSMTPLVMIDRQGRFAGALGSAGGNSILAYVAKSMVASVEWGLPMQNALALPNLVARGDSFQGEMTKFTPGMLSALAAKGVALKPGQGEDSGLHGVIVRDGRIDGGYDPRREGKVIVE
ncbi:gamma-glutamyltransferase family protein [Sphingomonas sp. CFBP 13720]|uniref:gamma-glutamyltransferase family protein n=1 Tax=Sphingomonas sp. CFBP 13720 TaxID=2775302 RepID=UPI0017837985|nr:gamma-glutamyltransferase family protein [Sphingomonas sp. CFBP 13720]MBD8677290.1 gamma-glutamyltransferase family protein [Sphingomonas sp. CFBP 13720]